MTPFPRPLHAAASVVLFAVVMLWSGCASFPVYEDKSTQPPAFWQRQGEGMRPMGRPESWRPGEWFFGWHALGPVGVSAIESLWYGQLEHYGGDANLGGPWHDAVVSSIQISSPTLVGHVLMPDDSGYVNFLHLRDGPRENAVAWAWREFECPRAGWSVMRVGSDDAVRVWLNGQVVHNRLKFRGAHPDQDFAGVWLREGRNLVLVKVQQGSGDWGFYLRFDHILDQHPNIHWSLVEPPIPPVLLTGAAHPIEQSLELWLMNTGRAAATSATLILKADGFAEVRPFIPLAPPGQVIRLSYPLAPDGSYVHTGKSIINGEAVYFDGVSTTSLPFQFAAESRPAHALLRNFAPDDDRAFYIAQLSDTHIAADPADLLVGVNTTDRLRQAIAEINAMSPPPDFVVVTGDFSHNDPAAFQPFADLMAELRVPWLAQPGNHDIAVSMAQAERAMSQWGLPRYYSFMHKGWNFIGLDTNPTPLPRMGEIGPRQMQWLAGRLREPAARARVFFMHHDLFSGWGVANHDAVRRMIGEDNDVWFFSGHWHLDCLVRVGRQRHIITTSTGYLSPPTTQKFDHNQPGYRLIYFEGDETRTAFKPLGGEPRPDPPFEEWYSPDELKAALNR